MPSPNTQPDSETPVPTSPDRPSSLPPFGEALVNRFVRDAADVGDPDVRARYGQFAGIVGILLNIALSALKGTAGLVAGSVSVVADALNNLTDAASSIVSLLGFKLASRPADDEHPLGHGRYEYLAGSVVAVLVLFVGFELVSGSIKKIVDPQPTDFNVVVLAALAVSVAVKLWMMRFNEGLGARIGSQTLHATAVDSRNDAIATSAVLVAAVVSRLAGVDLDGWAGLAVGAFIVWSGIGLLRESSSILLGAAPDDETVRRIRDKILAYDGVLGTHDLMLHDYGPGRRFASAHVEVSSDMDVMASHDLLDRIEQDLYRDERIETTLHMDPVVTSAARKADPRSAIADVVRSVDPRLAVHDVRVVVSDEQSSASFHVERPADLAMDDDELCRRVFKAVARVYPGMACSVSVDDGYLTQPQSDTLTYRGRVG